MLKKKDGKTMEVRYVSIEDVLPDPKQPRKDFDATKLATLAKGIKNDGILTPLNVEAQPDGTYMILNGERRYRAAQQLKLEELPVLIDYEKLDPGTRLVRQIQLQAHHDNWNSAEYAEAIGDLAEEFKISYLEAAERVGFSRRTAVYYKAFYSLSQKAKVEFQKSEIPIRFTEAIVSTVSTARRAYENVLEKEFDDKRKSELEEKIVEHMRNGNITTAHEVVKLKDTFKSNPDTIDEFIDDKKTVLTPKKLYFESDARSETAVRKVRANSAYVTGEIKNIISRKVDVDRLLDDAALKRNVKGLEKAIEDLKAYVKW